MSVSLIDKTTEAVNNHEETTWILNLDGFFLVITHYYYVDDSEEWAISNGI